MKKFGVLITGIIALSLNNLASLYFAQGRHADAEQQFKRSIGILEKERGPDHPNVATSLNNLADFYRANGVMSMPNHYTNGHWRLGKKCLVPRIRCVAIAEQSCSIIFEPSSIRGRGTIVPALNSYFLGRRGPDHPNVAKSLNNLAEVYRAEGRYADAEPLYKRALTIQEKVLVLITPM